MDIEQIREKKLIVERQIRDLFIQFADETGLIVYSIGFEMMDISSFNGPRKMSCTAVTLDVRLDGYR